MKVKLVESILKESVDKKGLRAVLELMGQAHDKIMDALDEIDSLSYEYEDDIIDEIKYKLEDLEYELSEVDFIGENDPIQAAYNYFEIEDDDWEEVDEEIEDEEEVEIEESCKKVDKADKKVKDTKNNKGE